MHPRTKKKKKKSTHCWRLLFGLEGTILSLWYLHELWFPSVTAIAALSPAGICSDDPTRVHPFLMSGSRWPVFSCGLSAVCPLVEGRRESTQQPLSPPEGQLHRTGSHGELLMIHMMAWASHCLGYITQSGTNNRLQCHLIMAQKANLADLHSSQG